MEKMTSGGFQSGAGASAMDCDNRSEMEETNEVTYNTDEVFADEFSASIVQYGTAIFQKCITEIQRVEEEVEEMHNLNDELMTGYRKLLMNCVDAFDPELGSLMNELREMEDGVQESSEDESESESALEGSAAKDEPGQE